MRRMATMPNATVARTSPKKYSGRCNNMVLFSGFKSGCGLPAFEPNQPDEKAAKRRCRRDGQNPESNGAGRRRAIAVGALDILVGIHQVPVQPGRRITLVAQHLLRF